MGAPRSSYVKRARISAGAGPYLLLAGIVLLGIGVWLGPLYVPVALAFGCLAPVLQLPRQRAWTTQNDALEFASLAAMPVLLGLVVVLWLRPLDVLSLGSVLQALGGFFTGLGAFHLAAKSHTLRLADQIEAQGDD